MCLVKCLDESLIQNEKISERSAKTGEMFGEDLYTCQQSIKHFGANFGKHFGEDFGTFGTFGNFVQQKCGDNELGGVSLPSPSQNVLYRAMQNCYISNANIWVGICNHSENAKSATVTQTTPNYRHGYRLPKPNCRLTYRQASLSFP